MTKVFSDIRSILAYPIVYDVFQTFMGADKVSCELVNFFIRPSENMRILDIGCGTARILEYLPETVCYKGIDVSSRYINEARKRYGLQHSFECRSLEDMVMEVSGTFDLVLAKGVLHHLDNESANKLFVLSKSLLRKAGRLVTIDPCLNYHQNLIARFIIKCDRGEFIRSDAEYMQLASVCYKEISGAVKHRTWIPYTHWIMECTR